MTNSLNGKSVIRFDGASSFLDITDNTSLRPTNGITILAAVRPNARYYPGGEATNTGAGDIVAKALTRYENFFGWQPPYYSYLLGLENNNVSHAYLSTNGGTANDYQGGITHDQKAQITSLVYDGTTATVSTDGAVQTQQPLNGPLNYDGPGQRDLLIGASSGGNGLGYYFNGDVAEVLIYSRALTPTEQQQAEQYLADKYGTYDPDATWPLAYSADVQAQIIANQWNKDQADAYVVYSQKTYPVADNGLITWLKADTNVKADANGKVSSWGDQTIYGNNANQNNAGNQPTLVVNSFNGEPVIRFDGGSNFLDITDNNSVRPTSGITILAAVRPNAQYYPGNEADNGNGAGDIVAKALTRYENFFGWQPPYYSYLLGVENNNVSHAYLSTNGGSANDYQGGTAHDPKGQITSLVYDGTTATVSTDGIVQTQQSLTGPLNYDGPGQRDLLIGASSGGNGLAYYFNGDVAEILIYNRALTPTEQQQAEQYLADKYGTYNPNATWPLAYSASVQTEITRNQWNKNQADAYVAFIANNPGMVTAGLAHWYKADNGVTQDANGNVSAWADQTGNSPVAQTTPAQQPTYVANDAAGKPGLHFSGNQWLSGTGPTNTPILDQDITVITVALPTAPSAFQATFYLGNESGGNNMRGIGYDQSRELFDSYNGNYAEGGAAPVNQVFVEEAAVIDPAFNVTFYQNGLQTGTGVLNNPGHVTTGISVGTRAPNDGAFQGDIAEILVYDHKLSVTDLQQVNLYLANKYGLYNPNATWPQAYSATVQAEITRNQWNKNQADAYVALQANNPNMLTNGLKAWFKADVGVTQDANGNVSQWQDQTGSYSVTQTTAGYQPTFVANDSNGQPALRFNGSQSLFNPSNLGAGVNSDMTLITVASTTNPYAQEYSVAIGNTGSGSMRSLGYNQDQEFFDTYSIFGQGAPAPAAGVFTLEAATLDPTLQNVAFYQNGSASSTTTLTGVVNVGAGLSIGTATFGNNWQGDIAEVLIYDHQLSAAELQQVHLYLANKYGIQDTNYTPTITPNAGSYASTQTVTITQALPYGALHYTLDGTPPTARSPVYTGPINLTDSALVQAAVFSTTGNQLSNIASAQFYINDPNQTGLATAATQVSAASVSSTEIDLSWTSAGSLNYQFFNIYRSTNGGAYQLIGTVNPQATGFTDRTVVAGNAYTYQVGTVNQAGMVTSSASSSISPAVAAAPMTIIVTTPAGAINLP